MSKHLMSAEIELAWGESVLCRDVVTTGKRFVIGEAASADFVAPVETHVVRVAKDGAVCIESPWGTRALGANAHECIQLGPLSLRVSHTLPETERFASSDWLLELGCVALVALYAGLASVLSVPEWIPPSATAETLELQQGFVSASFGFSIEREDGNQLTLPVEQPAAPKSGEARAIFAETRARAWSPRARLEGPSVRKNEADRRRGGTGTRAKGLEGPIGAAHAPPFVGTWAMRKRDATRLAKDLSPRKSAVFSFRSPELAYDEEIVAEWGEETDDSGEDAGDVVGNMFDLEPVDPPGTGLGVRGEEPGGGGQIKRLGTGQRALGHGNGLDPNDGRGVVDEATFRRDVGLATHAPSAPSFVTRVAPELVERVLARARGHFRACGATGENIAFDVELDGSPTNASTPNACVARVLSRLRFLPAGKVVTRVRGRVGT